MSSVNSNFGNEALTAAMAKKATDAQGQIAMALLSGAAQTVSQTSKMNAPVAPVPQVTNAPSQGAHVDTYA